MTLLAEANRPSSFLFLAFLQEELAPRPGRLAACARITGGCVIVVVIAMIWQIPIPAYMAYIVFLCSGAEGADTVSTLLVGVVGGIAATIAVVLSLVFYAMDASEPALRLFLMAVSAFAGMFLVRTLALGPVAFLASFVLVMSQTLIDQLPTLEALTRLVLWLWVVVMVPAVVTILINLVLGVDPAKQARSTALQLLNVVAANLRGEATGPLDHARANAVALIEQREHAGMLDRSLRQSSATDSTLIETLSELLTLVELLPADTPLAARAPLAAACESCITAFERNEAPSITRSAPPDAVLDTLAAPILPVVVALAAALDRLAAGFAHRATASDPPRPASAKAMFVPDAFSNPAHVRFALKTTAAIMLSYCILSGLDWPEIRTAITTCYFVALGTFGETMHKLTLRLSGAVIGGMIGYIAIVYVLPRMTDIGQLSLLIAAVSFACAWISTSSERLSYAGMQAAFAFFLCVLQGYGPTTDLGTARDRIVGILVGNVLMTLAFTVLWPVSAAAAQRASLAKALRALGQILGGADRAKAGSRLGAVRALVDARRYASIAFFEFSMVPKAGARRADGKGLLGHADRLAAAVFAAADQAETQALGDPLRREDERIASWLDATAAELGAGKPIDAFNDTNLLSLPNGARTDLRAAIEARRLLRSEIADAVAQAA